MKLFGGFRGNRSKNAKKVPISQETEVRIPAAAEAPARQPEKRPAPEEPAKAQAPAAPVSAQEPPKAAEPVKAQEPRSGEAPAQPEAPRSPEEPKPAPESRAEGSARPEEKPSLEETRRFVPASQQPETPDEAAREGTKEIRFRTPEEEAEIEQIIAAYQKKKKRRRIIALAVIAVLIIGGFALWKGLVKPPAIIQPTPTPSAQPTAQPTATARPADPAASPTEAPPEETPPPERMRRENVYTIMLVGRDQGLGNTDAIMVGVFDVAAGTVDVVSIPRDTCANVESDPLKSELKKISGVYSRTDFDGLRDAVSDMVGFPIDCYVSVGVNGFIQLVNTIGGVTFNVPHNMNYDDPTQDLHIHFSAGEQYLDGYDAIKVVRWRQNNDGTNYGDIDRINTQQAFLKTVIKKCLSLDKLVTNLDDYIKIFQDYVKTDLSTGNMTWFAKEVLKLNSENIHFYTMPTNPSVMIYGFSYGTVLVDEWMELLNEHLNPYDQPIGLEDVDIIYRDEEGNLCTTSGEVKGGMESFLHMEDYVRRLNAWQASQQQDEDSASADSGDTNGGE